MGSASAADESNPEYGQTDSPVPASVSPAGSAGPAASNRTSTPQPDDGQRALSVPADGAPPKDKKQKKKALALASAWLKTHEEYGAMLTSAAGTSLASPTSAMASTSLVSPTSLQNGNGASFAVLHTSGRVDQLEGVKNSGMAAVAEPTPLLERIDEVRRVDAQLVRQGQEDEQTFSDKEHLSKMYVANGGGQSELEKQEKARLQKSMDLIVVWRDLNVAVASLEKNKTQRDPYTQIHSISGFVAAGHLLAVCGCAGAGKSALLQSIAGTLSSVRDTVHVSGEVTVNGVRVEGRLVDRATVAYVPQESVFNPNLTVRQTMRFAAALSPSASKMSKELLDRRCADLLTFLKLDGSADKKIGGGFQAEGISRAERRRLGLATAISDNPVSCRAIIDNPAVILFDGFDDGLPAAESDKLIGPLLGLASNGAAIVVSSSQPSSKLWGSAHTVCLMTQGRCKFFGTKEGAVPYFNGAVGAACPLRCNPAEYFMSLMDPSNDDSDSIKAKQSAWETSIDSIMPPLEASAHPPDDDVAQGAVFSPLLQRAAQHNLATGRCFSARLLVVVLGAFVAGAMYEGVGKHKEAMDPADIDGRAAAFFLLQCIIFAAVPLVPVLQMEQRVMAQEIALRKYSRAAYTAALWLARFPFNLAFALFASLLITLWTSIGFTAFHFVFVATLLSLLAAEGLVAAIASLRWDASLSSTAASLLLAIFVFCQGFLRRAPEIPPWLIWVHYIAFPTYSFQAMMVSEFNNTNTDPGGLVMSDYGMEELDAAASLGALAGFAAIFHLAWVVVLLVSVSRSVGRC